jgi:hypothetical protein
VPNRVQNTVQRKAARDKAMEKLWDQDPNFERHSVQELVDRFNNNPNHGDIQATPDTVKRYRAEYKKRKKTMAASNPRSDPKDPKKKKPKNN